MGTPFLGELKIISWNFAPKGWAFANGQFLPINQNQALFSLYGTMYGGNGQTTFAIPDMRGRVPIHVGGGFTQGERAGQETHTVTIAEMPQHVHFAQNVQTGSTTDTPGATEMFATAAIDLYHAPTNLTAMEPAIVGNTGGSQPHENRQPYLALNFIVALQGVFPSQN